MRQEHPPNALDVSVCALPLSLAEVFGNTRPCVIEVGFGEGEFLIEAAAAEPGTNFLGIEIKTGRYKKALKRSAPLGLANLRFLHFDAEVAAREIFAPDTFEKVLINFPDPWPKEKHQKHRIINPEFLAGLSRVTTRGGIIEIASDHEEYIEHILVTIAATGLFENTVGHPGYKTSIPGRTSTRFENEFREKGALIHYLRFTNTKGPGGS